MIRPPRLSAWVRSLSTLPPRSLNYGNVMLGKTLAHKQENTIRCTIFDRHGDIVVHGKDFKRSSFMKHHGLVPRDFRKISRHHPNQVLGTAVNVDIVPSIVTRDECILLNLLNIRALIKSDCVVIFDTASSAFGPRMNESHSQSIFLKKLREILKNTDDDLPYEFRALEAILVDVITNLNTEMTVHSTVLQNILAGLENSIERVKLRYLLIQSKKVTQFHQKASLIRDLLEDILESDDELNAFFLTEKVNGTPRQGTNHAEIEFLLESYLKTSDEIVQTVENLRGQIKTSEEIINIVLDSNRNELMVLGLKFSIGLLSMGVVLYVAAVYGMNLENFIEESDGGFEGVTILSTAGLVILFLFSLKQLHRLQRMTMSGVGRDEIRTATSPRK